MAQSSEKSAKAKRRRGPGRPFKPGQSGNPGGRPKTNREIVEMARGASEEALRVLRQLARKGPASVRVQAAKALLDRGYGKPTQTIAVTGLDERPDDVGNALQEMTDEQLRVIAGEDATPPAGGAAVPRAEGSATTGGEGEGAGDSGEEEPR